MSAQPANNNQRPAIATLQVRSVGRPAAVNSLARLLLELHARPSLRVVPPQPAKDAP